jgi:hypothetical protein
MKKPMFLPSLVLLLANWDRVLIQQIAQSGRVLEMQAPPSQRLSPPPQVAPGAAPLFSFRYFEGKQRHRFGELDLVIDDAGH